MELRSLTQNSGSGGGVFTQGVVWIEGCHNEGEHLHSFTIKKC